MTPLLQLQGVTAGYGDVQVLWGVDMEVAPGSIACLIGSNGAGKSTLLRCISGLVRATGGSITFAGRDLTGARTTDIVAAGVVHVPEGRRLFAGMSVRDNLLMGAYKRDHGRAAIRGDLERVFGIFPKLAERRHQDATTMSGGEQQMCAIGRGIMAAPELLMIDELSLGLSPRLVEELCAALVTINQSGVTILLVEQDVLTALELADRGYVLDSGRIVLADSSANLANNPAVQQAYLGSVGSTTPTA
jgi:branched-chain amino acid transport system ATP-binding protein